MSDSHAYYHTLGQLHQLWKTVWWRFVCAMRGIYDPVDVIWRYFRTRRLHFTDREALETGRQKGCISSGKMSYLIARGSALSDVAL